MAEAIFEAPHEDDQTCVYDLNSVCSGHGTCVELDRDHNATTRSLSTYCVCDHEWTGEGDLIWSTRDCTIFLPGLNTLLLFAFCTSILVSIIMFRYLYFSVADSRRRNKPIAWFGWPNRFFVMSILACFSVWLFTIFRFTGGYEVGRTLQGTILFMFFQNANNFGTCRRRMFVFDFRFSFD